MENEQTSTIVSPHSEEAERGVVGSLLMDWERCSEICYDIGMKSDMFFTSANRILFEAMMNMDQNSKPIDFLTLGDELKSTGRLQRAGGYDYIEDIMESTPTSAHFEYYSKIVIDKSKRRAVIDICSKTMSECHNDNLEIERIVSKAEESIFSIDSVSSVIVDKDKAVEDIMQRVRDSAKGKVSGNPFPWPSMNEKTGGLRRKCVTPLLGRDGQGKSTLLTYLLEFWGTMGLPTLVFPFEDGAERYMMRMGGKDLWSNFEVENCSFADTTEEVLAEKIELIESSIRRVKDMPIYFADGMMDAQTTASVIRKMHRKYGIVQVVVDNAKDVITDCAEGLTEGQGRTTRILANVAKTCDLNVLISSHVHDVQDDIWLARRNIKGSKEQKDGARQCLIFQNAFNGNHPHATAVTNKYMVSDKTRYLQMEKNNFGQDGLVGVCLDQNFRLQSWTETEEK
mgnify:FL=1